MQVLLLAVRRLPPITTRWTPNMSDDAFLNRGFTFQCPAWRTCALQEVLLTKVHSSLLHLRALYVPERTSTLLGVKGRLRRTCSSAARCWKALTLPEGASSLYLTRLSRAALKRL